MIKVFHRVMGNHRLHVANINLDNMMKLDPAPSVNELLEMAFRLTQNIDGSWSRGPLFETGEENYDYDSRVELVTPLHVDSDGKTWGHRSTMMFDEMELNGKTYTVNAAGFSEKQPLKISPIKVA